MVGEARPQGVVTLEPSECDLGTIRVGYPVTRTFTLVNHSDGVLQYTLDLACSGGMEGNYCGEDDDELFRQQVDENATQGDGMEEDAPPVYVDFSSGPAAGSDGAIQMGGVSTRGIQAGRSVRNHSFGGMLRPIEWWVEGEEGGDGSAISAHSRKQVTVVVHPQLRQSYSLSLRCMGTGGTDTPLAVCEMRAEAYFPSVLITDVQCETLPKQVSWQMLSLSSLNTELHSAITSPELQVSALDDKGQLTTSMAAGMLRPFCMDMGTLALQSEPRHFRLQLSSAVKDLAAHWEVNSYDDPQVRWHEVRCDQSLNFAL